MKGLAVNRLTLDVSVYDQADEAADRQDEHHRGRAANAIVMTTRPIFPSLGSFKKVILSTR